MAKSDEQVIEEFDEAVNMSARELEEWLQTEESWEIGQKDGGGESRGHESGCGIVEILEKDRDDYTEDDVSHMGASWVTSTVTRPRSPRTRTSRTPGGATPSRSIQMKRAPELRFSATLDHEPKIELALV